MNLTWENVTYAITLSEIGILTEFKRKFVYWFPVWRESGLLYTKWLLAQNSLSQNISFVLWGCGIYDYYQKLTKDDVCVILTDSIRKIKMRYK